MFVSGVGGTGNSFLIHAVKCLIDSLWPTDDIFCAIAAPTGLAVFNVGGVTIHRLFQLPIEHEGKQASYWSLSKAAQKLMRRESSCSCIGLHLSNRSKVEGKVHFRTRLLPFHSHVLFIITFHFLF